MVATFYIYLFLILLAINKLKYANEQYRTMVAPTDVFIKNAVNSPNNPQDSEIRTEYNEYCLIFLAIILAAAAGRTSSEFIINSPTHLIESATVTATSTVKIHSKNNVFIFLLVAITGLTPDSTSLLKIKNQINKTTIKRAASI